MRKLFVLLALLALAIPSFGQTNYKRATYTETYSGSGRYSYDHPLCLPRGTDGGGGYMGAIPAGVVALYNLGNSRETIRGGYDLNGTTQYFARTAGAIPCASSGALEYPCSMVALVYRDATSYDGIINFGNGSTRYFDLVAWTGGSNLYLRSRGATTSLSLPLTGGLPAGQWVWVIGVATSSNSWGVYSSAVPAGATSSTDIGGSSGYDRVGIGLDISSGGTSYHDGRIAYSAILPVAFSADQRTAIYAGSDPVRVAGLDPATLTRSSDGAVGAVWKLDNDSGVSTTGVYDLTASGSPTAQSHLIVARDLSGGGYHVKASTAAPTYSTSIGNGQGGGVFASASSQFLLYNSTPPVSAAPFQVYAVAQQDDATSDGCVWWCGDKDFTDDFWVLDFVGSVGGDPTRFWAIDTSSGTATTSATFVANTNYLLWGQETSATSRASELNGGSQGTNSTNLSPDNADSWALGMRRDSTPDYPLPGEIHFVLVLSNASTTDQASIERFLSSSYALGF